MQFKHTKFPTPRFFTLIVNSTIFLLASAALLAVLGIFNSSLKWDLFGPRIEAVLYGIFGSCAALAAIGVATTGVLGIYLATLALQTHAGLEFVLPEKTKVVKYKNTRIIVSVFLLVGLIVGSFQLANYFILRQRVTVFRKLAAQHFQILIPKLEKITSGFKTPPNFNVPTEMYDLVRTIDQLPFVQRATVYLPDPQDQSAQWGYTAWREYHYSDGFARYYVTREFEKQMQFVFSGKLEALKKLNQETSFESYLPLFNLEKKCIAIVRIDGKSDQNYREYYLERD